MASVTAVIPNYNQRNLLANLLQDLGRQSFPPSEILVVDNGSEDDSVSLAKQLGARVIQLPSNQGFCVAVNRGVSESRGEFVAVLNNDVELDCEYLRRLLDALGQGRFWFATGKIYRADSGEVLDGAFDAISRAGCAWRCGEGRRDAPVWNEAPPVFFAPFTAAMFRRELFEKVGFLDEEFESYLEDVDFGLRCATAGMDGRYIPEAVAYHRGSATLGAWHPQKTRLISRNQLLLVAKHYPKGWWQRLGWPVVVGQLLWGLVAARHGAGLAYWKGKLQGLRRFRDARRRAVFLENTSAVVRESERSILRLQRETGFDWYWRLYFLLT